MKLVLSVLLLTVLAVVAQQQPINPGPAPTPAPAPAPGPAAPAHEFTYKNGGDDWEGTCKDGKSQSPVDLDSGILNKTNLNEDLGRSVALEYHYHPIATDCSSNVSMIHNGHALQVNGDLGYVLSGNGPCCGEKYNVKQFHFHAPSEHTVDGKQFDMEMHIVHQKEGATGKDGLLVVGILFNLKGTPGGNPFLRRIEFTDAPKHEGEQHTIHGCVDINLLLNSLQGDYYAYKGSLTTPTCDETVSWRVMAARQGISRAELDTITALFAGDKEFADGKGNARKTQPLNGRNVIYVHTAPAEVSPQYVMAN